MSYDRYKLFKVDGRVQHVPSITLTPKSTDYTMVYERGKSALNNISYEFYGDPNYDWLIMLANAKYGALEFDIPDNSIIRIPYPLDITIEEYTNKIKRYDALYGIE